MSDRFTHSVTLVGKDQISQVFVKAGSTAKTAAQQIAAGGAQAAAALDRETAAATRTGTSLKTLGAQATDFRARNQALGADIGAVVSLLSDATRAAQDEAAGLDRLANAVENTGASYGAYASQIDAAVESAQKLSFADDEAVNALNTLTSATKDTGRALELMSTAQDLARGKGISLAAASEIVGKVAQGNLSTLGRYGIVLDKNATSTEALAELQKRFSGQAATFADSGAGSALRFQNNLDNLFESIGEGTGRFQGLLAVLPGVTSGMTLLGGIASRVAERALPSLDSGFKRLIGSITPLSAGLGALGLAGGALILMWQKVDSENKALAASFKDLDDVIESALDSALQATAKDIKFDWGIEDQNEAILAMLGPLSQLDGRLADYNLSTEEQAHANELMAKSITNVADKAAPSLIAALGKLEYGQEHLTISGGDALKALELINDVLDTQGSAAGLAQEKIDVLNQKFADGQLSMPQYLLELTSIKDQLPALAMEADAAAKALNSVFDAKARSATMNFTAPGLSSLFLSPSEAKQNQIDLKHISDETIAQNKADDDKARADRKAARDKEREEVAQAFDDLRKEADAAAEARAEVEERLAGQLVDITRNRIKAEKAEERDYQQELRGLQAERVDQERALSQELRDIEQQRKEVALDTESQLRDLAQERGEVQAEAAREAASVEREWAQTSQEAIRAQADVRRELQATTAQAARDWHALQAENARQLRELKADLQSSQRDSERDFGRDLQDNETARVRVNEDLQIALSDPNATDQEKYEAQLRANRELADLATERQRLEEDFNREQKEAADALRQAKRDAAAEEKQAQKEYREQVKAAESEANQQLAANRKAQEQAHKEFLASQQDAQRATSEALADLDGQQRDILAEQAAKFQELEQAKRTAIRDSAREQQTLARDTARAEETYLREVAQAQREADREARAAQKQYNDAIKEIPKRASTNLLVDDSKARPKLETIQSQLQDVRSGAEAEITIVVKQQERATSSVEKAAKPRNVEQTETKTTVNRSIDEQVVQITGDSSGFDRALAAASAAGEAWTRDANYVSTLLLQRESFVKGLATASADGAAWAHEANFLASAQLQTQDFHNGLQAATTAGETWSKDAYYLAQLQLQTEGFHNGLAAATTEGESWEKSAQFLATILLQRRDFTLGLAATAAEGNAWAKNAQYLATLLLQRQDFAKGLAAASVDGATWAEDAQYAGSLLLQREDFVKGLGAAEADGAAFAKSVFTPRINANAQAFNATVTNTLSRIKTVDSARATVGIEANLAPFWKAVNDIAGDTVATASIRVSASKSADSGLYLGGTINNRVPAAALGRTLVVGEFGPEILINGNQIVPNGAAQARLRADADSSGLRAGPTFNGPVHFHMAEPSVAKTVAQQLRQRGIT